MYSYPGGNQYARQPPANFGAPPPGMAGAPGMVAPGVGPPPGMQQADQGAPQSRFPPAFQPPANMPNINFNAPVIRLGTTGSAKPAGQEQGRRDNERGGRMGLGMQDRRAMAEATTAALVPPTKDEMVRTIFIGGITEGVGAEDSIERILRTAGALRRWTRATDADDKPCRFGFAEYEDPDSLATAIDVLKEIEVPTTAPSPAKESKQGDNEESHSEETEKAKLLIFVDDATTDYLQSYENSRGDVDPSQKQARLDSTRQALANILAELANPSAHAANQALSVAVDGDGDQKTQNGENADGEIVTIPLNVDDELADIPAEMRETVAKEIAAFRERSNRRDLERLKREEEIEAQERGRGSPGRANAIPVGPRDKQIPNAPSGPKGFAGTQMPKDYQKNLAFVNGTSSNGWIDREEEDTDADDEELERRKQSKKAEEQEKEYLNQERKWLNRERTRTAAIEREKARDRDDLEKRDSLKDKEAKRYRDFDDTEEASRKVHDYYADHSQWARSRASIRAREANLDDLDRANEDREKARSQQQQDHAKGVSDDRNAMEVDTKDTSRQEPQRFKLSLGAAAQKAQTQAQSKKLVADVDSLLEDDEADQNKTKRTLIPIKFDPADARKLTPEENSRAATELAGEIPKLADKEALFKWSVPFDSLLEEKISGDIRPWYEAQMVDILGVQDEFVGDLIETHLKQKKGPQELLEELEGPFDTAAEEFVRNLWRRVILYAEAEKRGISL